MLSAVLTLYVSAFAGVAFSSQAQTTAPNEWTWMGGSNAASNANGPAGVYGTQGTPSLANIPGGRDSAATWTDGGGHFWLFGGEGNDANGNFGGLNDLWEFDPAVNEWTWMGGSNTVPSSCAGSTTVSCGQPGVYGSLGVAAATNIPGGRVGAATWTDSNGNFWLFGGYGFDADQNAGELNDLWEFNFSAKEWAWMAGSSTIGSNAGQPGVYGTLGSAAPANIPGGRDNAAAWTDNSGSFWLFGGEGVDANGDFAQLDDVWEFDPTTKEWSWMGGSSTLPTACATATNAHCGWPTVYGALGVAAPGIGPGSRVAPATWKDKDGNFWLFGGLDSIYWEERDFSWVDQYDLWEFSPTTQQWAWMGGSTTATCSESTGETSCEQKGVYGTQGTPSIANIPPSRNSAIAWTDTRGNFWLFGGAQSATDDSGGTCADFWVFEPAANEWAWMGGDGNNIPYSCFDIVLGTYGTLGTPAAANIPSGRSEGASWIDSSGNLWLFGGRGYANGEGFNEVDLNDVWVYQPTAPAPEPSFEVVASPNPINIAAEGPGTTTITTGSTTVNVLVADGFDAPVALTATPGTCNGVTCVTGSFNPPTVTGAGSSTLTISVNGALVSIPEPYPLTITATSGSTLQSIQVIADVTDLGQIPAPTFSVPTGTYSAPLTVSLTDTPYIFYTTDGTTPTASSAVFVSPITITSTTTLKAIAIDVFNDQSPVSSATYTIAPATSTPSFMPDGGAYSTAQTVSLSDSTSGATIYDTTNGSTPTTSSTVYSAPITISSTETVQAVALASGDALSAVATAVYTIGPPTYSITGTPVTVTAGMTTGNTSTITVTPSNGFTGVINLSCEITPTAASDAATCLIPSSLTISGSAPQTTTLTISTTAAESATSAPVRVGEFPRSGVASTLVACILLFGIPAWRRRLWSKFAMLVLLLSLMGVASGCGGGGGGGTSGGGNPGTTPGTYVITVTGTSGSNTQQGMVSLSVE